MQLFIVNETGETLPEEWQDSLTRLAMTALELENYPAGSAEISLVITDDARIAIMNKEYRDKEGPTDVLSFAMQEDTGEAPFFENQADELILGDIVISLETAKRQAEEFGHSLEREVGYLFVHGLLHLLGHDHMEEEEKARMRAVEERVMESQGLMR